VAQWTSHPPRELQTRVPGYENFRESIAMLWCKNDLFNIYIVFVLKRRNKGFGPKNIKKHKNMVGMFIVKLMC
jgi:hypothetical protein